MNKFDVLAVVCIGVMTCCVAALIDLNSKQNILTNEVKHSSDSLDDRISMATLAIKAKKLKESVV